LDRDGNEVRQGLSVYGNKGSTDQHAFVQQLRDGRDDFFVMFVQVLDVGLTGDVEIQPGVTTGDYLQGFLLGTRSALIDEGRPVMTLTVPTVDARSTGALIALFERAVSFYGTLININPYHQPGVEAGKKAAALALEMSATLRGLIADDGQTVDALSNTLNAPALDVYFLLQRLEATGRVRQDLSGREVLWVAT
jgi:glucose-6-phosphate isomerase